MKSLKWFLIGVAIATLIAAYVNREALQIYSVQAAEKRHNEERLRRAEAERARLLGKRAELETSIGQEKQARERGYKRAGERPLFMLP
jgi:hypothetical protein